MTENLISAAREQAAALTRSAYEQAAAEIGRASCRERVLGGV